MLRTLEPAAAMPLRDAEVEREYSISDLTSEFGITARALRFYEDEGLIAPARRGTARIYSRRDRARLAWILRGKRVGFSLADIREMIDLYDLDDGRTRQRQVTVDRCVARIALLREQQRDIDETVAELHDFIVRLGTANDG